MTKLSEYRATDRALAKWVRDVRQALTATEGGLSWADNVGETITFKTTGTAVGVTVPTRMKTRPSTVLVLAAVPQGVGASEYTVSCTGVAWKWSPGAIELNGIAHLSAGVEYEITLGVMG